MPTARDTIPLSRGLFLAPFDPADPRPAVRAWQAHVDAGRIGRPAAAAPAISANRAAIEALLRRPCRPYRW